MSQRVDRRGQRRLACAVLLVGLGLILATSRSGEPGAPAPAHVDINRADEAELQLLPGIGPAMAARIARDRAERGPFWSVDDLTRVTGVGERTVRRLRPHATVGE